MEDFDYPGVYGLSVDGEILYVGSSRNIKRRLVQHFSLLRKNAHKKELQEAYNDGKDVVPICLQKLSEENSVGELYESEAYWIDELNPVCTEKKPLSEPLFKSLSRHARGAMERRFRSESPENEYMKMHHENIENWYYSIILSETEKYFTPMKNEKRRIDCALFESVIIKFPYEERLKINKLARKRTMSTESFIKEIVREYIENL